MADPVAAAEANSREIRVFISSTFRDFMEERRLLATQVFPEINRRARERGVELVEVDLRWGVTQEQVEDGRALEIYLKEIERCRPYFIGMLGDSYGSITPTERQLLTAAPERVELLEKRQWLAGQLGEISYTALEIGHSLELLRDQQLQGRAFFYFRDSAWSAPKADAGEAGWRSDDPAERQKLELLRSRIRSSGHPLVEGLQSPQAIADRIKEDLWALIDRQFPEGEQPDALEREERKHADYRRSRTRPGEYVGCEGYIQQLERWIEDGQQQILITGESGAGKSALIANWMERHSQSHPADVMYAHHLGCTNDANALRPLLGRLIDTASQQLLEAEVIRESLAVPEDWWELVAKVAETLQTLGRWCEQQGKRWIWVLDGLDRLELEDQQALPWLPLNLPDGVQVVASSLACPAREILNEQGYSTLPIEPLGREEQEQLIQRYLQRYTKELDGGLRQLILSHPLAGSPLFLKVLLEEMRQCGRHDTLRQQLDFYLSSQTVDDLYERVLERLENDGNGEAVRKVMTALWASRAGLTEPELLGITDLKPLQWAPIDLALENAFGRNGNRLVFDHDFLRIAVKDRYLPGTRKKRRSHAKLATWFDSSLSQVESRKYDELPWQLLQAGKFNTLRKWLLVPWNLANLSAIRGCKEVLEYWEKARRSNDLRLDELILKRVKKEINSYLYEDEAEDLVVWLSDVLEKGSLHGPLLLRLRQLLVEWSRFGDQSLYLVRLVQLAHEQHRQGLHRDASAVATECLNIGMHKLKGLKLSSLLYQVAVLMEDAGEHEEALALFQQCLDIEQATLKAPHPYPLMTRECIASIRMRNGDLSEGQCSYQACIEGYKELLGHSHPTTMSAIRNFAVLLFEQGAAERALPLIAQHANWCQAEYDATSIENLYSARILAAVLRDTGNFEGAERQFRYVIDLLNQLPCGLDHVNTRVLALGGLAITLEKAGKLEEAATFAKQSLDHRLEHEGPDAWRTNRERLDLARVLHKLGRSVEATGLIEALQDNIISTAPSNDDDRQLLAEAVDLRNLIEARP